MARRRSARAKHGRLPRRAFLACAGAAALGAGAYWLYRPQHPANAADAVEDVIPAPTRGEWRAVWVSYLEWQRVDFSSEDAFRAEAIRMAESCAATGLNTIIAQVRPFGDALYESALYPWSHLCTGTQGLAPGFDPLDILLSEAHTRGISVEAWVNPYRLRSSAAMPPAFADTALVNTHPEWVVQAGDGLYLNPAIPEAADYVIQGVAELVERYPVDGVHMDDYFYPSTDPAIDAQQLAAAGRSDLTAWRRENVTALVRGCYRAVKAADPTLRFGVSPQGNPDNDLNQQYSDISLWLTAEGDAAVVDYLCPQIYWGYHYTLSSGSQRFAFENITAEWLEMPRAGAVALYFGLGGWRIGDGDGGANDDSVSQWNTGHALANQIADLRAMGSEGYAVYRYDSLFNSAYPELAAAEQQALAAANGAAE